MLCQIILFPPPPHIDEDLLKCAVVHVEGDCSPHTRALYITFFAAQQLRMTISGSSRFCSFWGSDDQALEMWAASWRLISASLENRTFVNLCVTLWPYILQQGQACCFHIAWSTSVQVISDIVHCFHGSQVWRMITFNSLDCPSAQKNMLKTSATSELRPLREKHNASSQTNDCRAGSWKWLLTSQAQGLGSKTQKWYAVTWQWRVQSGSGLIASAKRKPVSLSLLLLFGCKQLTQPLWSLTLSGLVCQVLWCSCDYDGRANRTSSVIRRSRRCDSAAIWKKVKIQIAILEAYCLLWTQSFGELLPLSPSWWQYANWSSVARSLCQIMNRRAPGGGREPVLGRPKRAQQQLRRLAGGAEVG